MFAWQRLSAGCSGQAEIQKPMDWDRMTDKKRHFNSPGPSVVMPFEKSGEYYIEDLGCVKERAVYAFLKRSFDIVASAVALVILLVPMVAIGAVVALTSDGGPLYIQERLGKNGKPFDILKFRTMRMDAEEDGAQWSSGYDDSRITPVGLVLRKYRLDELPQLWCILKGDMSFVGPRPERACFYDAFETYIHGFRERLKVKPGLTGLAQIRGYYLRPEEKVLYDVEYIKDRSVWLDIKILAKTLTVVLRGGSLLNGVDQKVAPACRKGALTLLPPAAPTLVEGVAA